MNKKLNDRERTVMEKTLSQTSIHSSNQWLHQGGNEMCVHFSTFNIPLITFNIYLKKKESILNKTYVRKVADLRVRFLTWVGRDEGVKDVNFLGKFKEKCFPLKEFFSKI